MRALLLLPICLWPSLLLAAPLDASCFSECFTEQASVEIYPDSQLLNEFSTHLECEQHAYHRAVNIYQLYDVLGRVAPVVCNAPQISPFVDAVVGCHRPVIRCDVHSDFVDGGGKRVWKPESEATGNAVFLLEPGYCSDVESVKVLRPDGSEVSSQFRHCRENGNRYHHDLTERVSGPLTVQLELSTGVFECVDVPDAEKRFD